MVVSGGSDTKAWLVVAYDSGYGDAFTASIGDKTVVWYS